MGVSIEPGILYVVSTPIGNLGDITQRALEVLGAADAVLAEDTRHTRHLLDHFGIGRPLLALHEHNERAQAPVLLARIQGGETLALVSDAGTPLLSDPGFHLVRALREAHVRVLPVPGASALLAALAVSGLPTDRFVFEGFLPARGSARRARLVSLAAEARTLVFYEAPHRVLATLADLAQLFGADRPAVLARELTKRFETVLEAPLGELHGRVEADPDQRRGEMVLVVAGAAEESAAGDDELRRVLPSLLEALPPSRAAAVAAKLTGARRQRAYALAVEMAGGRE